MSMTWGRVLVGIGVLASLLGIGALEVLSQRVRVDPAATAALRSEGVAPEPSGDSLALDHDDLLGLDADPVNPGAPTPGVGGTPAGAGRLTVLEVDEKDRRLLSMTGRGRVFTTEVSNEAVVVTEDRKRADLAFLKPGDVIRIEPSNGQIQRIVLLRPAWRELTSPEQ